VHQWNEFTGQENGHGMPKDYWGQGAARAQPAQVQELYGDEYNLQLSDDIEPTALTACAYRGCGGWGYYYYNLTRAIISLYRGATPGITVLALSGPATRVNSSTRTIDLRWAYLGKEPSSFAIQLDGKVIAPALPGSEYELDLSSQTRKPSCTSDCGWGVYALFAGRVACDAPIHGKASGPVRNQLRLRRL
jgi:hypothetical protein